MLEPPYANPVKAGRRAEREQRQVDGEAALTLIPLRDPYLRQIYIHLFPGIDIPGVCGR